MSVASLGFEPASFRDPSARVFRRDGRVLRALGPRALRDWEALAQAPFFQRMTESGRIVRTTRLADASVVFPPGDDRWVAALEHDAIPVISYPYEWPFGMLKDAALAQLEVLRAALADGFILKDGTPFNVQWTHGQPVFIDIGSITKLESGRPWEGYRQFCQLCLYPLMLQAYKDIEFQPWLRGRLDGILPSEMRAVFSAGDAMRGGVVTHVFLQAAADRRSTGTNRDVKADLSAAGFHAALIDANARRLQKLIGGLAWKRATSTWSDYASTHSYEAAEHEEKQAFVRDAVTARPRSTVWDLGCNTGTFSRIAAAHADRVVAVDADQLSVERLYQSLKGGGPSNILPLVGNVADPAPGLGWLGRERVSLPERSRPSLVLCLALVHHVALSANVPVGEFIAWLASLGGDVVIEFVSKADPMAQRLLRNKEDVFADYEVQAFESSLDRHFTVERRHALANGTRVLYYAVNRQPERDRS